ncbi:MAG: hypothetical protein JTJ28_22430 [Lactobacillus sp.]|nr:hypothetical protein [Lactobacillus sp.]
MSFQKNSNELVRDRVSKDNLIATEMFRVNKSNLYLIISILVGTVKLEYQSQKKIWRKGEPILVVTYLNQQYEITADFDGRVIKYICEPNQIVDYGTALFIFERINFMGKTL